jgi:hypothetical protein
MVDIVIVLAVAAIAWLSDFGFGTNLQASLEESVQLGELDLCKTK